MEKRLFLAVALSLIVVFVFQTFWGPKPKDFAFAPFSQEQSSLDDAPSINTQAKAFSQPIISDSDQLQGSEDAISHSGLKLTFSTLGAKVSNAELTKFAYSFPLYDILAVDSFNTKFFTVSSKNQNSIEYKIDWDDWVVYKTFKIVDNFNVIGSLKIRNTAGSKRQFPYKVAAAIFDSSRLDKNINGTDRTLLEYLILESKKSYRKNNLSNFSEKWDFSKQDVDVSFLGLRDRYFAMILQPQTSLRNFNITALNSDRLALGFSLNDFDFLPDQTKTYDFNIYLGPQKLDLLNKAGKDFQKILVFSDWAWLDAISKLIYWLLGATYSLIPVWGLCIILVSLVVYGAMFPLTMKSLLSMRKMQAIQPKIKQVQEKFKNNPEKVNQEILALYKQHGVNPLGGCLPMILQMPIFVGLYQVLWRSFYFRGESFLRMKDLSQPDHLFKLPFEIPFLGSYFNLLPIVMVFIMMFQQKMSNQNMDVSPEQAAQQKMMATVFPVMIGFIFYNFSSGLNVYFVVFYLLSAITQWHISRSSMASLLAK
jgi:YidC/Oxa1 family membrane protein insertase